AVLLPAAAREGGLDRRRLGRTGATGDVLEIDEADFAVHAGGFCSAHATANRIVLDRNYSIMRGAATTTLVAAANGDAGRVLRRAQIGDRLRACSTRRGELVVRLHDVAVGLVERLRSGRAELVRLCEIGVRRVLVVLCGSGGRVCI